MMIQSQITVDKARNDVFSQYKLEHKLIMRMIGKLPGARLRHGQAHPSEKYPANALGLVIL